MPRNNFLAIALMALLSLLSVGTASANEKKVWVSSQVASPTAHREAETAKAHRG